MERKKIDLAVVILHYLATDDTIECVSSMEQQLDTERMHIIIVDNASPDGSGKQLTEHYRHTPYVTVICNESNLGFANGNNVGFRYAKEHFDCRYIVLSNNDIVLFQKDMLQKLDQEFEESHFAVWGPMVLTRDGRYSSSPSRMQMRTKNETEDVLRDYRNFMRFHKLHLRWIYVLYRKLFLGKGRKPGICDHYKKHYQIMLHGCFMVFSQEYISRFDGLCDKTFMYGEEDILYLTLLQNQLTSVYDPSYAIYHKEDVSTDNVYKSSRKKLEFYYSNLIRSTEVLLTMYD